MGPAEREDVLALISIKAKLGKEAKKRPFSTTFPNRIDPAGAVGSRFAARCAGHRWCQRATRFIGELMVARFFDQVRVGFGIGDFADRGAVADFQIDHLGGVAINQLMAIGDTGWNTP